MSYYTLHEQQGILTSKVTARISSTQFRDMLLDMKRAAKEKHIDKLLVDAQNVNFQDLTISERHDIGLAAAEILKNDFKGACVVKKEYINKHGENVANNRGANVLVVGNIEEAYQWLRK